MLVLTIRSWSAPSKASHTMDSNAAAWFLPKLQLQEVQPIIHNLV